MQKPDDVLAEMSDEALIDRLAALGFVQSKPIDWEALNERMKGVPHAVMHDSTAASDDTDLRPE